MQGKALFSVAESTERRGGRGCVYRDTRLLLPLLLTLAIVFSAALPLPSYAAADPDIEASTALVYCENTEEVVYSRNADVQVQPYSTTKLLTALIAIEETEDLDREVTISEEAAAIGEASMELSAGEVVTIRQLLYGTLLLSGNDAAYALAEAVGGDVDTFVEQMNAKAEELGCTNSHFTNPMGYKEDGHYTTAEDYLLVAHAAWDNETERKIISSKTYEMPATNKSEARTMKSHVDLIHTKGSGIYAGKTGLWDEDSSIVAFYEKKDLRLTLLVYGVDLEQRPEDVEALLTYAVDAVPGEKTVKKGEVQGSAWVRHGRHTRVQVRADGDAYTYLPEDSDATVKTENIIDEGLEVPLSEGDEVGEVQVTVDGEVVATAPLVLAEDVETGWLPSYFYLSNRMTVVITVLLVLFALCWFRLIKRRRKRRKRRKSARYREQNADQGRRQHAQPRRQQEAAKKKSDLPDTYRPKH